MLAKFGFTYKNRDYPGVTCSMYYSSEERRDYEMKLYQLRNSRYAFNKFEVSEQCHSYDERFSYAA